MRGLRFYALVTMLFVPWLIAALLVEGGPAGNSVGQAQLRTATGSSAFAVETDLTMNDYAFYPSETNSASLAWLKRPSGGVADPSNTIARTMYSPNGGGGTTTIRWRYMTSTDNPYWWVCAIASTGVIVASWVSDDPPTVGFSGPPLSVNNFLGQPDPLVTCKRIQGSDLQALGMPASSYLLGDAWARSHGYSLSNRDFRAIQHFAGNLAPSEWLLKNFKLSGTTLMPQTILPPPINIGLP